MPLTARGEAIFERIPNSAPRESTGSIGCEIVRHGGALHRLRPLRLGLPDRRDRNQRHVRPDAAVRAPPDSRRGALGEALRKIARHQPSGPIEVPGRVSSFRSIVYEAEKCIGCGACAVSARPEPSRLFLSRPAEIASSRGGEAA